MCVYFWHKIPSKLFGLMILKDVWHVALGLLLCARACLERSSAPSPEAGGTEE